MPNMNPAALFLAEQIWGESARDGGYRHGACICHDQPQTRADFRDDVSWNEFLISALCAATQNSIFGDPDEG
jgi:hypothetical protein